MIRPYRVVFLTHTATWAVEGAAFFDQYDGWDFTTWRLISRHACEADAHAAVNSYQRNQAALIEPERAVA